METDGLSLKLACDRRCAEDGRGSKTHRSPPDKGLVSWSGQERSSHLLIKPSQGRCSMELLSRGLVPISQARKLTVCGIKEQRRAGSRL